MECSKDDCFLSDWLRLGKTRQRKQEASFSAFELQLGCSFCLEVAYQIERESHFFTERLNHHHHHHHGNWVHSRKATAIHSTIGLTVFGSWIWIFVIPNSSFLLPPPIPKGQVKLATGGCHICKCIWILKCNFVECLNSLCISRQQWSVKYFG